jgi:hypothetical protein
MRLLTHPFSIVLVLAACTGASTGHTSAANISSTAETATAATSGLVGTWDAITRSAGGIGGTTLFRPDGTVALVIGAMVDAKYKVDGDKFTIYNDDPGMRFSENRILALAGDTAIFSADGRVERKMRIRPGGSGVVGVWRFTHMTGVPAYEEYTDDGFVRLRVPMQVMKGTYSVTGNKIRFHILTPRRQDSEAEFLIRGDTLAIGVGADKQLYLRARPLIPYEVEQPVLPSPVIR